MFGVSDNDVIEHFDFKELSGADQVAGDFDVRFRWCRVARRVIVLCGAPIYVERVRENKSNSSRPLIRYNPDDPGNVAHRWHPPAWHRP